MGSIPNDDLPPTLTIDDGILVDGDAGTVDAVLTLSLSFPIELTALVRYATADGTATSGSDYTAATGTLTFAPGVTTQTVAVPVLGDTTVEPDETFTVTLSGPTNATLADGTATGTISNDDAPTLAIGDVSLAEGNVGSANAVFTVTLSAASAQPVMGGYGTSPSTSRPPSYAAVP